MNTPKTTRVLNQEELAHDLLKADENDGEQKGIASLRRNLDFRQLHLPQQVNTAIQNRTDRTYRYSMQLFQNGTKQDVEIQGRDIGSASQRELHSGSDKFCYERWMNGNTGNEMVRSGMYFHGGQQLRLSEITLPNDIRKALEEIGCVSLIRRPSGEWEPMLKSDCHFD